MGEKGDKLREAAMLADQEEELQEQQKEVLEDMKRAAEEYYTIDEYDIAKELSKRTGKNLTEVRKELNVYPNKYVIQEHTIPDLVKQMRVYRRELKGDDRTKMSKSIDNLIDAYSDHLQKCIDEIYWIRKYEVPLRDMNINEDKLSKLNSIKDGSTRQQIVDTLCKYWEAKLDLVPYDENYSTMHKQMSTSKKEFGKILKGIKEDTVKSKIENHIIKMVCNEPGIGARQLHDSLDEKHKRRSSPQIISKMVKELGITNVNGSYYKFDDEIKKNIWAYTAAFLDSDGYITMDKNNNPRVGLIATGERGKAFIQEMHKSIGIGRPHLDQKSPQDTRPVNRLNFYSQEDVKKLLLHVKPHLRLKKQQADTLLELIRIKQNHKKAEWAKPRMDELFKLMKWYNHSDNTNYDWDKYGVDIDSIGKLEENNKMNMMDNLENITKGEEE